MRNIYLGLLLTLLSTTIFAQDVKLEWAKSIGGSSIEVGRSITTDSGNVYVTGQYGGTVDFDPGPGIFNLSSPTYAIFVLKLDNNGNFMWAKSISGFYIDQGRSITTDISGNVYVSGIYSNTVDFDPGTNTYFLTANGSLIFDVFILKLDASGSFIWAKSMGGPDYDESYSVSTDKSGNVYATGYFQDTADFDPGPGTYNLISNAYKDIFVLKLDSAGNFIWAKSMGGKYSDLGQSITIDPSGNVYTTGYFVDTVDFDPGINSAKLFGFRDVFIQKLDAGGNFIWAKSISGIEGHSITTDISGNVYITGEFNDTVDFDPGAGVLNMISNGSSDIFILKLNSAGNLIWAKSMGGWGRDVPSSIVTDLAGNVYTTGTYYEDTVDFDPDASVFNLIPKGGDEIFVQKLDSAGNFIWAKSMGGSSKDIPYSIVTDSMGNLYLTGFYIDTADFDPSVNTYNLITDENFATMFVVKLGSCTPSTGRDVFSACDSYTWIDGNTYNASNNNATHTLANAAGCDSIVTLNLTINIVNVSVTTTDPNYYGKCNRGFISMVGRL